MSSKRPLVLQPDHSKCNQSTATSNIHKHFGQSMNQDSNINQKCNNCVNDVNSNNNNKNSKNNLILNQLISQTLFEQHFDIEKNNEQNSSFAQNKKNDIIDSIDNFDEFDNLSSLYDLRDPPHSAQSVLSLDLLANEEKVNVFHEKFNPKNQKITTMLNCSRFLEKHLKNIFNKNSI
jgi:hypothetical protein